MKKKIQILTSGISLVDEAWGGFYRGGTYLLVGPHKSGRTLLSLQYAMESAKQKEVCLYFTSMRPKDLMIQAASIDFDLQHYMNQNLVIVVRVAPPSDLYEVGNPDEFLAEYFNDIVTVVEQYQPSKVVFDELTPFIGFNNIRMLRDVFARTTETIEDFGITSLLVVGDPATPAANMIVDAIASCSTGILYLHKNEENNGRSNGGKMVITPNVGHTEGQIKSNYTVEPYKGITVDYKRTNGHNNKVFAPKKDLKYTSLADISFPSNNFTFSNFYSFNDFSLILNNQIALYKSTGQSFSVISLKLDPSAEREGLITLTQLQNTVRLASDKKEKICLFDNKILLLVSKEDPKNITGIIGKIKSNLPSNNPDYLSKVLPLISVFVINVNESIQNAEDVFQQIITNETEIPKGFKY